MDYILSFLLFQPCQPAMASWHVVEAGVYLFIVNLWKIGGSFPLRATALVGTQENARPTALSVKYDTHHARTSLSCRIIMTHRSARGDSESDVCACVGSHASFTHAHACTHTQSSYICSLFISRHPVSGWGTSAESNKIEEFDPCVAVWLATNIRVKYRKNVFRGLFTKTSFLFE